MISGTDIYWLAGLLEGEGCFSVRHTKGRQTGGLPIINVWMTDRDVIERAGAILKCSSIPIMRPGTGHNRKLLYGCRVHGLHAAEWMMTLYPLMGERRRERIKDALAVWKRTGKRGCWDRAKNRELKTAA